MRRGAQAEAASGALGVPLQLDQGHFSDCSPLCVLCDQPLPLGPSLTSPAGTPEGQACSGVNTLVARDFCTQLSEMLVISI